MATVGLAPTLATTSCLIVTRFTVNLHCRSIDIAHAFCAVQPTDYAYTKPVVIKMSLWVRTFGVYTPIHLSGLEPDKATV